MNLFTPRRATRRTESNPSTLADDLMDEASSTSFLVVDETRAIPKPNLTLHAEKRYDHLAEEQRHLHEAAGTRDAGTPKAEAAGFAPAAKAQVTRIEQAEKLLLPAVAFLEKATQVLWPHVTRSPHDTPRYYLTMVLLLGGDVAGIAGAAIALGEIVWLAVAQALSVAIAMIAMGTLAAELKHSRLSRQRQKDKLSPEEEPFAYLFAGPDPGEVVVKFVVIGGLISVLLVGIGVLSLRYATEGSTAGLVFGCLSTAIALGSWANSWTHGDPVADKLEHYEAAVNKSLKRQKRHGTGGPLAAHERYSSQADSIVAEYQARGRAAVERVQAAKHKALEVNPGVAGHGVSGNGVHRNGHRANGATRSNGR